MSNALFCRHILLLAALAFACALLAPPRVPAASPPGALSQAAGAAGCVNETGADSCGDGTALTNARDVAVSPDGAHVYLISNNPTNAVSVFDRNAATGALTQKGGLAACISETGAGPCTDGRALLNPRDITISPDGHSVYVAGSDSGTASHTIAAFDRSANGTLTQKAGNDGCLSEDGGDGSTGTCHESDGMTGMFTLAVSPDGQNVYGGSFNDDAVIVLDRNPSTGAIIQKGPAPAGCVAETNLSNQCVDGVALNGIRGITVSPDDNNVYAASTSEGGVAVFDRAANGGLTQKPGVAGCVTETGSAAACQPSSALTNFNSGTTVVESAPDGGAVYLGGAVNNGSIAALSRNVADGQLTSIPPTGPGCIMDNLPAGSICQGGFAMGGGFGFAVSPDGRSLYWPGSGFEAIAVIDVDGNGLRLSQRPHAGCIASLDFGPLADGQHCAQARMGGVIGIAVSPDGRHVYGADNGDDGVVALVRELPPTCRSTSAVTTGAPVGLTLQCSDPNGDATSVGIVGGPGFGTLGGLNSATGAATYTPNPGFTGIEEITFGSTTPANAGESDPARALVAVLPAQAGPVGPAGPAGPSGSAGPQGPPAFRLELAIVDQALRGQAGRRMRLRYLTTLDAQVTLEVRGGSRRVARIRGSAEAGRNQIAWNGREGRRAARPGRYTLRLSAVNGNQTASDQVRATLRRAKSAR